MLNEQLQKIEKLVLFFKLALIMSLINANLLYSQTNYQNGGYNFKNNSFEIINGINLVNFTTALILNNNIDELTFSEIDSLIQLHISGEKLQNFDKYSIYNYSDFNSELSDFLLTTLTVAPILTNENIIKMQNDYEKFYFTSLATTLSLNFLTKSLVERVRPYVYNLEVDLLKKQTKDAKLSFYSGHTSLAFTSAVLTGLMYEGSNSNKLMVWATSLGLATTIGILRLEAGRHFITDVLAGAIIGTAVPLLLHNTFKKSNNQINQSGLQNNLPIYNNTKIINFNLKL